MPLIYDCYCIRISNCEQLVVAVVVVSRLWLVVVVGVVRGGVGVVVGRDCGC